MYPGPEIPRRPHRVIRRNHQEPGTGPLVSLFKARLRAGHQLLWVGLSSLSGFDRSRVAELREFVKQVPIQDD
jgi:hypothetical protein